MLKLAIAVVGFPFFPVGCLDASSFAMSWMEGIEYRSPNYTLWVATLWLAFVTFAQAEIGGAMERIGGDCADLKDRLRRRGKYDPERWWYERYPGHMMISMGEPRPALKGHYDEWKAEMINQGFGPEGRDLTRLRG